MYIVSRILSLEIIYVNYNVEHGLKASTFYGVYITFSYTNLIVWVNKNNEFLLLEKLQSIYGMPLGI